MSTHVLMALSASLLTLLPLASSDTKKGEYHKEKSQENCMSAHVAGGIRGITVGGGRLKIQSVDLGRSSLYLHCSFDACSLWRFLRVKFFGL